MTPRDRQLALWCALFGSIGCVNATLHGQKRSDHLGSLDNGGFVVLFDGKTLDGWHAVPEDCESDWSVRDGVILGHGSANRLAYLVWKDEQLTDFELRLRYRLPGRGNTGVEIRSQVDKSGKRPFEGYHADLGHVGIGPHILGAWDFHFANRREFPCPRGTQLIIDKEGKPRSSRIPDSLTTADIRPHQWNDVRIVARGRHFQFFINDKLASEFTDQSEDGRLDHGAIGLQIHDKSMQVEFSDIRLKQLVASHDRREATRESSAVAPPPRSKYLLLDSRVVESVQNARLAVGTVQKYKGNPLFKEDQPWEPRYDNVYANVIYDEEQDLYKCWYSPFVNDSAYANTLHEDRKPGTYMKTLRATGGKRRMGVCYATSKDGIHWTKPLADRPAFVTTSRIARVRNTLRITADATGGLIRVTAIDAAGNELATSQPITDDVTDRPVVFPAGFKLNGHDNSIRLRFELDSAKLYAFSF